MSRLRDTLARQQTGGRERRGRAVQTPTSKWRHGRGGATNDRASRALARWNDRHFHSRAHDRKDLDDASDDSIEYEKPKQADDAVVEVFEAMEADVELIDEIEAFVRRHLVGGGWRQQLQVCLLPEGVSY